MPGTILIVEDDDAIRLGLVDAATIAGYRVLEAADGAEGLRVALDAEVDVVLLDVLMPRMDGFEVLTQIRQHKPGLAVIMLTARGEESDRIQGLRFGADDYVVKPFSVMELLARVQAVLRRSAERPQGIKSFRVAGRFVDLQRREVVLADGTRVSLSEREVQVLAYLASNAQRAISRDELLQRVWGVDPQGVHTRTIDMTIARLREQLRDDSKNPSVIKTVRAKGYMLAEADEVQS